LPGESTAYNDQLTIINQEEETDMTDELKTQPMDDRPTYEAPRALRLDDRRGRELLARQRRD